jgi:hypothetical protein
MDSDWRTTFLTQLLRTPKMIHMTMGEQNQAYISRFDPMASSGLPDRLTIALHTTIYDNTAVTLHEKRISKR